MENKGGDWWGDEFHIYSAAMTRRADWEKSMLGTEVAEPKTKEGHSEEGVENVRNGPAGGGSTIFAWREGSQVPGSECGGTLLYLRTHVL